MYSSPSAPNASPGGNAPPSGNAPAAQHSRHRLFGNHREHLFSAQFDKDLKYALLPIIAILIGVSLWYFSTQYTNPKGKKPRPKVTDRAGTIFTMDWNQDPVNPSPAIYADPPLTVNGAAVTQLMGFGPSFVSATCGLTKTQLKQQHFASVLLAAASNEFTSLSPPPGISPYALQRVAITPRFATPGIEGPAVRQVALWMTPFGFVIGDAKLDVKASAKRMAAAEVHAAVNTSLFPGSANPYAPTSAGSIAQNNPVPGQGSIHTTPLELLAPEKLVPYHADHPLHFRSAPFAYWTWVGGRNSSIADGTWPLMPTFPHTRVIWSDFVDVDSKTRWMEFLENGELRIVDRDSMTGALLAAPLWTASRDVTRTSDSGCLVPA